MKRQLTIGFLLLRSGLFHVSKGEHISMSLNSGTKLGPYEISSPLGSGGMGEVYKAQDTRLHRTVAIKISTEQLSERFEREARAVAALSHPHICQLYDVGPNYLVMEYVEGPPPRPPLPLDECLRLRSRSPARWIQPIERVWCIAPGNLVTSWLQWRYCTESARATPWDVILLCVLNACARDLAAAARKANLPSG